jgi:cold shock CspA family protein
MLTGRVVSEVVRGRGCWFIEQDHTRDCIFVHQKHVVRRKFLHINDRVQFNLAPNPIKPGEVMAVDVEIVGVTIALQRGGNVAGGKP